MPTLPGCCDSVDSSSDSAMHRIRPSCSTSKRDKSNRPTSSKLSESLGQHKTANDGGAAKKKPWTIGTRMALDVKQKSYCLLEHCP